MRIAGINIQGNKRLEVGLTAVYGVGRAKSVETLTKLGIDLNKKAGDLSPEEEGAIRASIEGMTIEGELRRSITSHIKRLNDIQSLRGMRHARGMKVRGQRTKTNNRTVPSGIHASHKTRKTMTSGRRKVEKK